MRDKDTRRASRSGRLYGIKSKAPFEFRFNRSWIARQRPNCAGAGRLCWVGLWTRHALEVVRPATVRRPSGGDSRRSGARWNLLSPSKQTGAHRSNARRLRRTRERGLFSNLQRSLLYAYQVTAPTPRPPAGLKRAPAGRFHLTRKVGRRKEPLHYSVQKITLCAT